MPRPWTAGIAVVLAARLFVRAGADVLQGPDDPAAKTALAKATFEAMARTLTVYDADGHPARTIGDRAIYSWPALAPDGTRLAVSKRNEATGETDIWIFDVATGASRPLTSDRPTDISPVWSPDGTETAYASDLGGSPGLYRRAADGTGNPGLLFA